MMSAKESQYKSNHWATRNTILINPKNEDLTILS